MRRRYGFQIATLMGCAPGGLPGARTRESLTLSAMRFVAFATDYDETLAEHGRVVRSTEQALERLRASGRKLVLTLQGQRAG